VKPQDARQHAQVQQMDAAMQWVLRLREDGVTERDIADWLSWYERDERNKQAFDQMQEFWHLAGGLAAGAEGVERIRRLGRDESFAGRFLRESSARGSNGESAGGIPQKSPSPRAGGESAGDRGAARTRGRAGVPWHWYTAALAASLTALAAIALWPNPASTPGPHPPAVQTIAVHETPLPDGSKIELAARTIVAVQYTERQRLLEMQNGEAYFSVAPNRERPFIVKVGKLRVRAVGTAFNIRHSGERVVVTVTKGIVDVYSVDPEQLDADAADIVSPAAVRVSAGSALTLAGPGMRPSLAAADPARALAWREGRLEYINEPLSAVIADVNRYSSRPVAIRDAAVAQLTFTGTVFTNSVEDWLQALPGEFPLEVVTNREERLLVASSVAGKPPGANAQR
jgi:transmembrane sensor